MKRLLAFLILLGGGFLLLQYLVGEDLMLSPTQADEKSGSKESPPSSSGTNLGSRQGAVNATVEQRGPLSLSRSRRIPQSDGSILRETVFELRAKDSQPLRNGMQQLDDVEVTLYEDGVPAARINAAQALVELGTDGNGNRSFVADKEVSLTDVVLIGLPGHRSEGLRFELARAMALIDDRELNIYTPSADDPVRLSFAGERSVTLVGKGLQARMPRDDQGALQRVDLDILSDPILTTAGVRAQASGRLHYAEDLARRTGHLSLDDDVVLVLDRGAQFGGEASSNRRGSVTATGDQLHGWLARDTATGERDVTRSETAWRMLQLTGAPAVVTLDELRVSTPRLTVLPGMTGAPFWITASGGTSTIDEIAVPGQQRKRPPMHGSSPRRIHLWQAGEELGAVHRAFGFPQWAIAPIDGMRVVTFVGATHLEDDNRAIDASDGIGVFHPDSTQNAAIARGHGSVELEQRATDRLDGLRASGNDGFQLLAFAGQETLDLGPPATDDRWQQHQFRIEHGELLAKATGSCRVRRADDRTVVELLTAGEGIEATLASREAKLSEVRWLRAEFDGEDVRSFQIAGLPAVATINRGTETLTATAPWIEQTGSSSLRLLPPDVAEPQRWAGLRDEDRLPRLRRQVPANGTQPEQTATTVAPRIDVHYLGRQQAFVDARTDGTALASVDAVVTEAGTTTPIVIAIEADRLRALPFALPGSIAALHAGGGDLVSMLPFAMWNEPWILGDNVRQITVTGTTDGTFEGSAQRLVLSTGAQSGLLVGDPESMVPARATQTEGDRVVTASGAQVRIFRDDGLRLHAFRTFPGHSTFVLPEIEMHRGQGGGVLADMRATCQGDIEMRPGAVIFHGPVSAQSLAPDGSILPDGLGIVAQQLQMELNQKTGEVQHVTGREVDLEWPRVSGHAAEIDLDLLTSECTARDPDGASVVLANGLAITGKMVRVNYQTLAWRAHDYRIEPTLGAGTKRDGAVPR